MTTLRMFATPLGWVIERYATGFMQALNVEAIRSVRFKIVVDYAHSPNTDVLPPLLAKLNVDVVPLNARVDALKIAVQQEDFDANLRQLAIIAGALNTNLGLQLDVAGEKIFLVDNHGHMCGQDGRHADGNPGLAEQRRWHHRRAD